MRREIDSLKEIVETNMKAMESSNKAAHAENETATERLRTDFEKLRTDMEKNVNTITVRVMGAIGLLGAFIAVLRFFT